jgi:large subunit ribosomal protein L15
MFNLSNLSPAPGSNTAKLRIGRGIGSGLGKTAGKGHKGQKARKGCKLGRGFEGGQTPYFRRIPKFGFKRQSVEFQVVNVGDLEVFADGDNVSSEALVAKGLIKCKDTPVKLLGSGVLTRKLKISLDRVSKAAKVVVEEKGGTVEGI